MIRDYGKNHNLTSAQEIDDVLNDPSRQPKADAWAEFRVAKELLPINHDYPPVSAITGINPWAENCTMMKIAL